MIILNTPARKHTHTHTHTHTQTQTHTQVWDCRNGQLLRTQQGHKGMVTCLYYAAAVKLLFSGSIDNTVGIWTEKGINLQVLQLLIYFSI